MKFASIVFFLLCIQLSATREVLIYFCAHVDYMYAPILTTLKVGFEEHNKFKVRIAEHTICGGHFYTSERYIALMRNDTTYLSRGDIFIFVGTNFRVGDAVHELKLRGVISIHFETEPHRWFEFYNLNSTIIWSELWFYSIARRNQLDLKTYKGEVRIIPPGHALNVKWNVYNKLSEINQHDYLSWHVNGNSVQEKKIESKSVALCHYNSPPQMIFMGWLTSERQHCFNMAQKTSVVARAKVQMVDSINSEEDFSAFLRHSQQNSSTVFVNIHKTSCAINSQALLLPCESFRFSQILQRGCVVISQACYEHEQYKDIILFENNFFSNQWSLRTRDLLQNATKMQQFAWHAQRLYRAHFDPVHLFIKAKVYNANWWP